MEKKKKKRGAGKEGGLEALLSWPDFLGHRLNAGSYVAVLKSATYPDVSRNRKVVKVRGMSHFAPS